MEQLRWTTVSSWVEETLELFRNINENSDIGKVSEKVHNGELFRDKKINAAKRVFEAIKARYLRCDSEKVLALAKVLNSSISHQEKCNHLLIYYLEYETLARLFMDSYVYKNFNEYGQKIFTQMDIDKFFEMVFNSYGEMLPDRIKKGITDSSMVKVRNTLYKNIDSFGWIDGSKGNITIKRPSLTPDWFVYTLYLYFDGECISANEVYNSQIYKRFLLNEFDIEYLITGAKLKYLIEVNKLGDINTITKREKGLLDYAKNYK